MMSGRTKAFDGQRTKAIYCVSKCGNNHSHTLHCTSINVNKQLGIHLFHCKTAITCKTHSKPHSCESNINGTSLVSIYTNN